MNRFLLHLQSQWYNLVENYRVLFRYYRNLQFAKVDFFLVTRYFLHNPFIVSIEFLRSKKEENIYAYGETPLTVLDQICKICKITKSDTVFELGCGRARSCFWLHSFIGCRVVGIDFVPTFIERAKLTVDHFDLKDLVFRVADFTEADLTGATVIYIYGTCLDDPSILKLIDNLVTLPKGTPIITVTFPLTEYSDRFEVVRAFTATFPWGDSEVYQQILK